MVFISDETLDRMIAEDIPYLDLTTHLLGISGKHGTIRYFSREETVVCGTEEAARILARLGVEVTGFQPSGAVVQPGQFLLEGKGLAEALHMGWKICQNLLDNCSAIATKTKRMVDIVHSVDPRMSVVTTRKNFPGIKALCVKAVLCGGGLPHRLGLSETVLVFRQHLNFMGGMSSFISMLPSIKEHSCEKKIIAEAETMEEAIALCEAGIDGVQFDKLTAEELMEGVPRLRDIAPNAALLASGGINESNADKYAATGVNALVTTSLYTAKPIDIGAKIEQS